MSSQQEGTAGQEAGHKSPETVYMERSAAQTVTATSVEMNRSAARSVTTDTATMERSAVMRLSSDVAALKFSASAMTYARGHADVSWSSPTLLAAGGDVHLHNGGAQIIGAGSSVTIKNGGAGAVLTRSAHVESGIVGLLVAGQADLDERTRVLFKPSGAAALGAGFAGGLFLAFAFLWRLFGAARKRGRRRGRRRGAAATS